MLDIYHSAHWKSENLWKKNRPLCGAKCRNGHSCKAKVVVESKTGSRLVDVVECMEVYQREQKHRKGKDKSREAARRGMIAYWARKKEFRP